ncbi:MAG TPA: histidine phosphatase family protein [Stellaceae bacterium]|jgi:phosphohistidine phosphatase
MSELYLLRHAKAVPQGGIMRDADRPLEERGRAGARAVAKYLKKWKIAPELVLCSPALRTRETLDLVSEGIAPAPQIEYENGLYLASADRLLERVREVPDAVERVMLIGHNPGLHELAQWLADGTTGPLADKLATNLATAGLVRFEVNIEWSGLRRRTARLVAVVTPKDLE